MQILGLLDSLESMFLDSFKIPFSGKCVIDEAEILTVIDKLRLVCQSSEDVVKKSIESLPDSLPKREIKPKTEDLPRQDLEEKAVEIIQEAYKIAKEVRLGADKYADEILSNLEVTANRILRTIRNGRDRISEQMQTKLVEKPQAGELVANEKK